METHHRPPVLPGWELLMEDILPITRICSCTLTTPSHLQLGEKRTSQEVRVIINASQGCSKSHITPTIQSTHLRNSHSTTPEFLLLACRNKSFRLKCWVHKAAHLGTAMFNAGKLTMFLALAVTFQHSQDGCISFNNYKLLTQFDQPYSMPILYAKQNPQWNSLSRWQSSKLQ